MRQQIAVLAAVGAAFSGTPFVDAGTIVYTASLSGAAEDTPNDSLGTGDSTVTIDTIAMTMRVEATFSGLTGVTTAAHIHGPTTTPLTGVAGVMTPTPSFPSFPAGVTAGAYDMTFDLTQATSFNPAFVAMHGGSVGAAADAMLAALAEGRAYINIHSSEFGSGEIRGFYIPSPGAAGLVAMCGVAASRRRRR